MEAKHRHAAELRKQIAAAEAAAVQKRVAAMQEGVITRAAEAARQAMVEVSHRPAWTQTRRTLCSCRWADTEVPLQIADPSRAC